MDADGVMQDLDFALAQIDRPYAPETRDLLARTRGVMETAQAADKAVTRCKGDAACQEAWDAMEAASKDVVDVLEVWAPYRR